MKLGLIAAGVAGAALIAGGPTAVWIVAHHEYGGGDDKPRTIHRTEARPDFRGGLRDRTPDRRAMPGSPGGPMMPGFPGRQRQPSEEMQKRLESLRKYAEWSRCVLTEARKADGAFDPVKKCGKAPDLPELPSLRKDLPEKPEASPSPDA